MTWTETYIQEPTEVDALSQFDRREQLVELRGTLLRDVYRLYLCGKFRGLVVGTTGPSLTEAVRTKLGKEVDL